MAPKKPQDDRKALAQRIAGNSLCSTSIGGMGRRVVVAVSFNFINGPSRELFFAGPRSLDWLLGWVSTDHR